MNTVTTSAGTAAHIHPPVGTQLVGGRRRLIMRTGLAGAVAAALVLASCSSDSKGSSAAAAATTPATAAAAPAPTTQAPTTTAAAATSASPEAELVAAVRPLLDPLIAALGAGDLDAAHEALEAYDAGWNGIEVYVNMRSLSMYLKLEADLQVGIEEGLASDAPDFPALTAMAEELAAAYDNAVELSVNGNPLHPLVDDVTTLRIIRAELRITAAALDSGDVAKAKEHFEKFKEGFEATAEVMLAERNFDNELETEEAVDAAAEGFANASATAEELADLVGKVTSTYNFGVSLWNAAARNADDSKAEVTNNDLLHLGTLFDLRVQLMKSMKAWEAGNFDYAGSVAAAAQTTVYNRVAPYLAVKGADGAVKSAVDAYVELAGAAGDAKDVGDANVAAIRATYVAEQAIVGQFWTDAAVQDYLAGLPEVDPLL